jgi:hypothetical protein
LLAIARHLGQVKKLSLLWDLWFRRPLLALVKERALANPELCTFAGFQRDVRAAQQKYAEAQAALQALQARRKALLGTGGAEAVAELKEIDARLPEAQERVAEAAKHLDLHQEVLEEHRPRVEKILERIAETAKAEMQRQNVERLRDIPRQLAVLCGPLLSQFLASKDLELAIAREHVGRQLLLGVLDNLGAPEAEEEPADA